MQGSLGEKIGEGAFSEAYAWAPGQVVKLFKAGVSHQLGRHELRMIRAVLAASPFHGEGHRKVWARLRHAGTRTSLRRVLRLMREHDLLAPGRMSRRADLVRMMARSSLKRWTRCGGRSDSHLHR